MNFTEAGGEEEDDSSNILRSLDRISELITNLIQYEQEKDVYSVSYCSLEYFGFGRRDRSLRVSVSLAVIGATVLSAKSKSTCRG